MPTRAGRVIAWFRQTRQARNQPVERASQLWEICVNSSGGRDQSTWLTRALGIVILIAFRRVSKCRRMARITESCR